MDKVQEKVDYRISVLSSYPVHVNIYALLIANRIDSSTLEKIERFAEVRKTFPFLNAAKIRGNAKDIVRLSKENFVKYISLIEVVGEGAGQQ